MCSILRLRQKNYHEPALPCWGPGQEEAEWVPGVETNSSSEGRDRTTCAAVEPAGAARRGRMKEKIIEKKKNEFAELMQALG